VPLGLDTLYPMSGEITWLVAWSALSYGAQPCGLAFDMVDLHRAQFAGKYCRTSTAIRDKIRAFVRIIQTNLRDSVCFQVLFIAKHVIGLIDRSGNRDIKIWQCGNPPISPRSQRTTNASCPSGSTTPGRTVRAQ
jgi:hypothetical protein